MAIKDMEYLSREDFNQAVVRLRLNITEISKELGIPRTYLSEFRNGDRQLRPEMLGKLRDFFESKGIEFSDMPETPSQAPFSINKSIPAETIRNALDMMEENDARLVALMKSKIERVDGFLGLGEGELTDETTEALQETFALLAGNYLVFRMLRGWPALKLSPTSENPETVRDMILTTFNQLLIDSGLIASPDEGEEKSTKGEDE